MNENDRNPAIRIHIDQQVFIDAILGAEEIEDATVVTEVVGFDRSESNYVLEGALAFTGYVRQQDQDPFDVTAEDLSGDVASTVLEDDMTVQQIHCRMPFTLEVPIAAQRTEFLNVTARAGTWNLHVLGPKWVHVRAELVVNGLTGAEGYRFRCGTQEEGFAEANQVANSRGYRSQATESNQPGNDSQLQANESQYVGEQPYYEQPPSFQQQNFSLEALQRQYADGKRTEYGESPFATPYISPFAAPSQPLTWERSWPQTSVKKTQETSSTVQDAATNAKEASITEVGAFRSELNRDESESADLVADLAGNFEVENTAVENFEVESSEVQESGIYLRDASAANDVREALSAPVVHAETEEEESFASQHTDFDQAATEVPGGAEEPEIGYHFEEVAESSAIANDPEFILKINSKIQQESSTFQAMSKLMEAGNSTRENDEKDASSIILQDMSSSVKDSSSIQAKQPSSTVANEARESSSTSSFSPSALVGGSSSTSPSQTKNKQIEKLEVEIGEAVPVSAVADHIVPLEPIVDKMMEPNYIQTEAIPSIVDSIEALPVTPGHVQQDQLIEAVVESKTVVDVAVSDLNSASVTIVEDGKSKSDQDRVYRWTELYPYLEENFQSMKFRIVQENETIERIAENYRIPTSEVVRVNHLPSEQIDIGQLLYIPVRK